MHIKDLIIINNARHRPLLLAFALFSFCSYSIAASNPCGSLANHDNFGPLDFNDPKDHQSTPVYPQGKIQIVVGNHFTKNVEMLRGAGKGGGTVQGEIDYTLRRIPNHPRALWALSRWVRKGGKLGMVGVGGWVRSIDCYFERAFRWRPRDPAPHMIWAMHLHLTNKMKKAEKEYKIAEKLDPKNTELKYNMGLFYFDLKDYGRAYQYAQMAYDGGYPLPGLRNKLKGINKWPSNKDN